MEALLLGFLLIGLLHVLEAISLRVKSQLTLDPLSFPTSVTPPVTTLPKLQILLPWTCPFRHLPTCPRLNWLNLSPPSPTSPSLQYLILIINSYKAEIQETPFLPWVQAIHPAFLPLLRLAAALTLAQAPSCLDCGCVLPAPLSPWGSLTSLTPPTPHSWKNPKCTSESFCLFGL